MKEVEVTIVNGML